ncbi:MAG: CotH kinase family protein [Lachnospiraceae bacterium]|nr:CotH kinase family protein [Lachnospiraceae bacterium]
MYTKVLYIKILLLITTVIFWGVFLYAVILQNNEADIEEEGFSVIYIDEGTSQQIKGFYSEDTLYFCMPGYVEVDKLYFRMDSSMELIIEGEYLWNNSSMADIELGKTYQVEYGKKGEEREKLQVVFMKGAELPVIQITTASGKLDYIHSQKGNEESGYIQVRDAANDNINICKLESIVGRGNTAWDAEKKSYTIKLDNNEEILGMEAEKSWILNANYYDGTYIRNQIGFELARSVGIPNISESCFVELYINDEYMGLYQIMEDINVSKHRINIENNYLLEIDYTERACEEENYIRLPNEQPIVIKEPKKDVDKEKVQEFFDEFAAKMESGEIPWHLIEIESFAKMFVMEELLQDMDFGYSSHYMYLDIENGILSEGVVWDLDNTMGRGIVQEPKELFAVSYDLEYNNLSRWYAKLYENKEFRSLIGKEYREHFRPQLENLITSGIGEYIKKIEKSIDMDQKRFPDERSVFMSDASLEENIAYLKTYLQDKLELMDACFGQETLNEQVKIVLPETRSTLFEVENVDSQDQESLGMLSMFMQYRGILWLLMLFILGIILQYQCRRTGK